MPFIETFGGLLLVLGSVLVLRAAWRADVGDAPQATRGRAIEEMDPLEERRAA